MSKKIKIFQNRKARFNYETIQKLEVGIVLFGNEIRSIRDGKVVLDNSYAVFKKGEICGYIDNTGIDKFCIFLDNLNDNNNEPEHQPKAKIITKNNHTDNHTYIKDIEYYKLYIIYWNYME